MDPKIVIIFLGLLMIASSIFNWNWWYESRKVKFIVKLLSRKGARILYFAMGVFFAGLGVINL